MDDAKEGGTVKTKTIILIDDLRPLLTATSRALAACGYPNVRTFEDPRRALFAIAQMTADERANILAIVSDYDMPHFDGCQLYDLIQDERLRRVFVLHSGSATESPSGHAYPKMMGVRGLVELIESIQPN